jgi:hypothetical protein
MNIVDSSLIILPESKGGMSAGPFSYGSKYGSGYGSYAIGNPTENFYGTKIKGTTYAAILRGGYTNYMSSKGTIDLFNASGDKTARVKGKNAATIIDSVFGFMVHGGPSFVNLSEGTEVNTQEATFLYKEGDATFTASNAKLSPKSGILLQMMDDDDPLVGIKPSPIPGPPTFDDTFDEPAGWPSDNGTITAAAQSDEIPVYKTKPGPGFPPEYELDADGNKIITGYTSNYKTVTLNLDKGRYTGNVYNGTGFYGGQIADTLAVNIGNGAALTGDIALTQFIHVDENGDQNTMFKINQYYYLGHVANKVYNNGNGKITVNLKDGAKWDITANGTSNITKLVTGDAKISAPKGYKAMMTVDGVITPIAQNTTYTGDIVIKAIKK